MLRRLTALHSRWIRRLRDAHPDHHAIAGGMAWVALLVLLGSSARAAKEVVIIISTHTSQMLPPSSRKWRRYKH